MPTYACSAAIRRLTLVQKAEIARSITAIHREETGAPRYLVQVIFYDLAPDSHYVAGLLAPADQILRSNTPARRDRRRRPYPPDHNHWRGGRVATRDRTDRTLRHDGEILVCRTAQAAGVPFCLGTMSICSIEDVAEAVDLPFWFQLYVTRDRGFVRELVERAIAAKCSALVPTLDLQILAERYCDVKNDTTAPPEITLADILDVTTKPAWALSVLGGKRKTFEGGRCSRRRCRDLVRRRHPLRPGRPARAGLGCSRLHDRPRRGLWRWRGRDRVATALSIICKELDVSMALTGTRPIAEVGAHILARAHGGVDEVCNVRT
jgi:phenylpyruvate tautomerase PptA (4-oxalocrotonate tautomerase family)